MPYNIEFLTPVLVLIVWTLIMWIWMYATRIPAMSAAKIDPQDAAHPGEGMGAIPSNVRSVADNYNHLHEQPTIFYALMFYIALTGGGDQITTYLAWGFVILRVLHSLVQATINKVMLRFMIFLLSSVVLIIMAGRAVWQMYA